MWVNNNVRAAFKDAYKLELSLACTLEGINYSQLICGKQLPNNSIRESSFLEALDRVKPFGLSQKDEDFYLEYYELFNTSRCCLPKGHSGPCRKSYNSFFNDRFTTKIKDCHTAPGADDVIFKNRTNRAFPILLDRDKETELRKRYELKQKEKLKAAIPSEQAATPILCATACFDMAALITKQYDPDNVVYSQQKIPEDIKDKLLEHADRLNNNYQKVYNMTIIKDGYLCDPWTLEKHQLEYWKCEDRKSQKQIQFCHVVPVKPNRFMTRGMNILPMTRKTNSLQGDESFPVFFNRQLKIAQMHQERFNSAA